MPPVNVYYVQIKALWVEIPQSMSISELQNKLLEHGKLISPLLGDTEDAHQLRLESTAHW